MKSFIVIPQRSRTLVSGQHAVSEPAATILGKRMRLGAKNIVTRWSSRKLDDLLKQLFAALSLIYLMGAVCLAGILLLNAFSP